MDAHPKRVMLLKHPAEFRSDPLRKENGDPRSDPYELNMRNRSQPPQQSVQLVIGEQQGVASGKKNITDLRVPFQIGDGPIKVGVQLLLTRTADHARPSAVAAIRGAPVGHQKENPVRIAMD
jgi:hypothetical protein